MLTNWQIKIISESTIEENKRLEKASLASNFIDILNVSQNMAQHFVEQQITTLEDVAYTKSLPDSNIFELTDNIINIQDRAKELLISEALNERDVISDLLSVRYITKEWIYMLNKCGINRSSSLADLAVEDLIAIVPITKKEAGLLIMMARSSWFNDNF
jgi:N utilization substance protein A